MILAALLALGQPQPQPQPQPLVVGEQHLVEALGARREVNVVLPRGYDEEPDRRWPVVYLLDGGVAQDIMLGLGILRWNAMWGRSEEAILVALETRDRQREMLAPTQVAEEAGRWPTAGESARFRDWIGREVMPMVAAAYRTDGRDLLVDESAAGHFVVESWLEAPAMFDGYAAISPSLWWNDQALSRRIAATPTPPVRPPLYLSLADEGGAFEAAVLRVAGSLDAAQPHCFSDRRAELGHGTSLHGLLPEALQYLLPTGADWLDDYGMTLRCERGDPALP
ncbi:alpha/beta hydrolase [Sphingomicrobium astaxanthinifaciens]|uniref:alpha/beta hydrolase n=1 Tax=Sphingomicrobium astaxanthinifaciens TaxID=1227949 RepID=UPI001FCC293D|nr:alpha/beta hydrolase-fold protein [Sphingomicrobium astaxanthinifaciens]MCJ7420874.1 alpha/beta hydrolase [Sphingomicrobium astaxanthinifaciens]